MAVKFLRKRFLTDQDAVRRFLTEAVILSKLEHPNIVRLIGLGRPHESGMFFVMEWVDGKNLEELTRDHRLNPESFLDILGQTIEGLKAAHDRGVVHCDLKPTNLILNSSGRLKISDFGLSQWLSEIPFSIHSPQGTVAFMAPEQVTNVWGSISTKTDVYGLASTIHYLLTGKHLYGDLPVPSMVSHLISPKPHELSLQNCSVSSEFADILKLCVEKDATQRPSLESLSIAISNERQKH